MRTIFTLPLLLFSAAIYAQTGVQGVTINDREPGRAETGKTDTCNRKNAVPAKKIFIRCGYRRDTTNNPLYVIDGKPYRDENGVNLTAKTSTELANLDPDRIQNIAILKGPEATALYGSMGFNGAVVINLKKDTLFVIDGVLSSDSAVRRLNSADIESLSVLKESSKAFLCHRPMKEIVLITTKRKTLKKTVGANVPTVAPQSLATVHRFRVFPTILRRGDVISVKADESKAYTLRILAANGNILSEQKYPAGNTAVNVNTGANWLPGAYFVQCIYEKGQAPASVRIVIQ